MYTIKDIMEKLDELAPIILAESWDNVGILVGDTKQKVTKIMCALDVDRAVLQEAVRENVDCIVTHHPFIFGAIKKVDYTTPIGHGIKTLIQNNISLISMHTNLDSAAGGINDIICEGLGITDTRVLADPTNCEPQEGLGRYGQINSMPLNKFIEKVKQYFGIQYVRVVGDLKDDITSVSVCSGSGSSFIGEASRVSQVYITGDVKFHEAQDALSKGLAIIDVGHYASEQIVVPKLKNYLQQYLDIPVICTGVNGEV
ncbi:MAG: Nif3-like dinuclear metal center hexameric protein, partial [Epulopiscium sp. Nele67-Bin001]